jgi:hypothetical protein
VEIYYSGKYNFLNWLKSNYEIKTVTRWFIEPVLSDRLGMGQGSDFILVNGFKM